ncbi:MAG: hypothetical protein HY937_00260 [Nitrosomonadales bacterium]|nr:hypothetical protein [Nitrosomonadales bacterium]
MKNKSKRLYLVVTLAMFVGAFIAPTVSYAAPRWENPAPAISEEASRWVDATLHAQLRSTISRNFASRQEHLDKVRNMVELSLDKIHKVASPKAKALIAARNNEMVGDYKKKLDEYKSLASKYPDDGKHINLQNPDDASFVQELGDIESEAKIFHRNIFLRSRLSRPTYQSELSLPATEQAEFSAIIKTIGLPAFLFVDIRTYMELYKQKSTLHKFAAKVNALVARYGSEKLPYAVREIEFFESAIDRVSSDVVYKVLRDIEVSAAIDAEMFKLNWELPLACPHDNTEYPTLADDGRFDEIASRHYRSIQSDPIFSVSLDMAALYVLGGCNVTANAIKANQWLQKAASLETAKENVFLACILFKLSKKTDQDANTIRAIEQLDSRANPESCSKIPLILM